MRYQSYSSVVVLVNLISALVFCDNNFQGVSKELGHHISDHNAINSTAILFLPYKEAISLDYCQ